MDPKKDTRFIHQLLDETYSFIPENDSAKTPDDLYRYFCDQSDQHSTPGTPFVEFLEELSYCFEPVLWREETKCYRFHVGGHCLDLPCNWGPLSEFNIESQGYIHIHQGSDDYRLLEIFSTVVGRDVDVVFLTTEDEGMFVSFIESGKEENLQDILKFAQKSFQRTQKKGGA